MGDENPICTLGDYSKPSHEAYRNTIELPVGNNLVPLLSDTIRLVQNGCLFHGLRSEDLNKHLKDFLKLVDSLDLGNENRERTRLSGSITTWEDLTTRFLAQFFPSGRTTKLHNDILMFQQHHEESLSEDLTLYANESWNDPRDLAKPVKSISLPQDVSSTSDRCLIELENQLEKALDDFDSHQEKRLSHLRTQLKQQQDDMIGKINLLWKTVSEKLNDAHVPKSTGNTMASKNTASISHIEREELRRKGIKSPSNEAKEGETTTDITPEHGHNITKEAKDEVKEVIDEEEKALGIQPRVMPEDGHIRLTTDDDISWLCWKTGFCCSSLVDDEDTISFYKGLLYLRAFVLFLLYYWEKHSIKQLINHQNQKTRVNSVQVASLSDKSEVFLRIILRLSVVKVAQQMCTMMAREMTSESIVTNGGQPCVETMGLCQDKCAKAHPGGTAQATLVL
ncbi:MAK10-like protein [Tanacetum coccineum]